MSSRRGSSFHRVELDLGADYFLRRHDPKRHAAKLVRQLQAIGYRVTLEEVEAA